jgi:uroporphyrinogen decarboxylase
VVEATRLVEKIVEVVRVADTPTPTPAPEENHGMIWYVNIEHEKALADPTRAPNFDSVRRQRTWTLAGEENILMGMVSNKKFVHALMDRILEFNLRIIRNVCRYDVDALMFGDDWGYQRGVVMGPKLWREFIKPRLQQMYAVVKSSGKLVFIHSCGKVFELFPDLIECGVDVFNPFQPEVIDVYEAKRNYGDRLSFYGGISTQQLLPYGSVSEVKDTVRRLIDRVGKNGGYIAAPAHSIPGDAKPENVAAMIEVLKHQ